MLHRLFIPALLCIWLLSFSSGNARASDWGFRSWKVEDGLPDNNVSGISFMEDGAWWISTYGGLVRFNGLTMSSMEAEPGIGRDSLIRAMQRTYGEDIWFAVGQGRIIQKQKSGVTVYAPEHQPNSFPRSLFLDADDAIWVSYSEGEVARILKGQVKLFGIDQGLPGNAVCKFAKDEYGKFWCASGKSLMVFQDEKFIHKADLPTETSWQRASCLSSSRNGGLWVSVGLNLLRYEESTGLTTFATLPENPAQTSISALLEDELGRLWAGLFSGDLYLIQNENVEKVGTVHHEITTLTSGYSNDLWLGASEGGVWRVRPKVLDLLSNQAPLLLDAMSSVAQDSTGNVWITGTNGFLFKREQNKWQRLTETSGWTAREAKTLTRGHDDSMWIGTKDEGVWKAAQGTFHQVPFPQPKPWGNIRAMLLAKDGALWVSINANLWRLQNNQWTFFPSTLKDSYIQTLAEDVNGIIWAGTNLGHLLALQNGTLQDHTPAVFGDAGIQGLLTTPDGSLWIGRSSEGLARLKNGRVTLIGKAQGLPQKGISHLVLDYRKRLWYGSSQGIFYVPLDQLEDVAEEKLDRLRPTVFGRDEGFPGIQSSRGYWPNTMHDSEGNLWFNMRTGTVLAKPSAIGYNVNPPGLKIEELRVDDKVIPLPDDGKSIVIKPEHRSVEIRFAAMSFLSPENVHLRHRLDGLDTDWIESNPERQAMYSRLPAGEYTFKLIGNNNGGEWSKFTPELSFKVEPFIWQTTWFRILALLLFTGVIALAARAMTKRRLRLRMQDLEREALVERERTRIARDMHDDLGASLTQIAITGKLAQLDSPAAAAGHIASIAAIAKQAVTSLDEIVWAVNPRNDTLPRMVDYIGQYTVDFLSAAGLECELDIPAEVPDRALPAEFRHHLFLAVKEALNNVVKHADASKVQLGIEIGSDKLRVTLEDNGKGFTEDSEKLEADGLRNMRDRLSELRGTFHFDSDFVKGSRVIFELPWPLITHKK